MHRGRRAKGRAIRRVESWALRAAVFCAPSSAAVGDGDGNMTGLHRRLVVGNGRGGSHQHVAGNDVSGHDRPESAAFNQPRPARPAFRVKRVDQQPTVEKSDSVLVAGAERLPSPSSPLHQTPTMAQATDLKASLGRWSKRLGTLPSLALPTDYPRTST